MASYVPVVTCPAADPTDPGCTTSYVPVETFGRSWSDQLTPQQGAEIAMAVGGLWAIAWGVRQVVILLRSNSEKESD